MYNKSPRNFKFLHSAYYIRILFHWTNIIDTSVVRGEGTDKWMSQHICALFTKCYHILSSPRRKYFVSVAELFPDAIEANQPRYVEYFIARDARFNPSWCLKRTTRSVVGHLSPRVIVSESNCNVVHCLVNDILMQC